MTKLESRNEIADKAGLSIPNDETEAVTFVIGASSFFRVSVFVIRHLH